jgi:hypothetical protein
MDDTGSNIDVLHKWTGSNLDQGSVFQKAKQINLSSVKFDGLPLAVAITMLHDESVKRDPARIGVTISLGPDAKQLADAEINLDLKNVTLKETLERLADSAGLEVQVTATELLLVRKKGKQWVGSVRVIHEAEQPPSPSRFGIPGKGVSKGVLLKREGQVTFKK